MGYYVHIHVAFACDTNEGVADLAKRHAAALERPDNGSNRYAGWFLDDLAERTGGNNGPKGGLSLWGMVGNYADGAEFCEALRPFWTELLSGAIKGGPCEHERVIVFIEREQTEQAEAYEIWREDDHYGGGLKIVHHMLPFRWMQM